MGDFDLVLSLGEGRMARDATLAADRYSDLTFSTSWQGGFTTLDCSAMRELADAPAANIYDPVKLVGSGGAYTAWAGRNNRTSRSVRRTVATYSPSALGLAAVLEDRQDARALFVDRDLGRFDTGSIARRAAVAALFKRQTESASNGALVLSVPGYAWTTSAGRPLCESIYDAGPLQVTQIVGNVRSTGQTNVLTDSTWVIAGLASDHPDVTPGLVSGSNLNGALSDGDQISYSPSTAKHIIGLQFYYNAAPAGGPDDSWEIAVENLAVIGDHGLTLTGTSAADYGVKASDALRWLIGEYCPTLTIGDVVDSEIGIPHLAFTDPQSVGSILNGINAYHGWAWGIWEDGRFDYHPYGSGPSRTWYVRAGDDGVELDQDGDDGSALFTDVVVKYSDPSGKSKTVGAPGTLADEFDSLLTLQDQSNPAVAAGVRRVQTWQVDAPVIKETAVALGALILGEWNVARRAGAARLQGYVTDEHGVRFPSYMVRGGDLLVVTDVGDSTPRRVVETTYTHANQTVAVKLDTTLQTVEAIVQHLGARATGRL